MKKIADILSIIFHPVFISTYGLILYTVYLFEKNIPLTITAYMILYAITILLTCLIPLSTLISYDKDKKQFDRDKLYLERKEDRLKPYLISLLCALLWGATMWRHNKLIGILLLGVAIGFICLIAINYKWKISAHLFFFGSLTGCIIGFSLLTSCYPLWLIETMFILALTLMWARIFGKHHSQEQVVAGYLLGLLCPVISAACYMWAFM